MNGALLKELTALLAEAEKTSAAGEGNLAGTWTVVYREGKTAKVGSRKKALLFAQSHVPLWDHFGIVSPRGVSTTYLMGPHNKIQRKK